MAVTHIVNHGNGIYILQTLDGFRTAHVQNLDLIWWWPIDEQKFQYEKREEVYPECLMDFWGKCNVYKTEPEAIHIAQQMYHEYMRSGQVVKQGIQIVRVYQTKNFPGVVNDVPNV